MFWQIFLLISKFTHMILGVSTPHPTLPPHPPRPSIPCVSPHPALTHSFPISC